MMHVLLYDELPEACFLRHVLLLQRFTELRIGKESYGDLIVKQPALSDAAFLSLPGHAPDSVARMLDQGRRTLCERSVDVKNTDRLLVFNMRYYPLDRAWFDHVLARLALTDISLVLRHEGRVALVSARWSDRDMDDSETAVIENTHDRLVDIGQTGNVLRLVSDNFSLRYFNSLRFGRPGYFQKCSSNIRKLHAEYVLLSTLPAQLRPFFPAVGVFSEEAGYEIEIIPSLDVAKLLLNGRFAVQASQDAFMDALETYLDACPQRQCTAGEYADKMHALFIAKTEERLAALAALPVSAKLDLTCRLNGLDSLGHFTAEYLALCKKSLASESGHTLVFSHGDLFFANILFDPITGKIKLVDPKGGEGDAAFMPLWYDIAKLSHSFLGRYDMLVHSEFFISAADDLSLRLHTVDMPGIDGLEKRFLDLLRRKNLDLATTRIFEAALFLSMLPLHADSPLRMQAQLLRALDIYRRIRTPGAPLCGDWTER